MSAFVVMRVENGELTPLDTSVYLTPRESEVLRVFARSWSMTETGHLLGISRNTVRNHLANARQKAAATSVGELLLRLGWLQVPNG